jgi:membrane fusion protein (multidrug efflux system)
MNDVNQRNDKSAAMNTDAVNPPANNKPKRNRQLLIAAAIFVAIGATWLGYWALIGRFHQSTDDAYVAGNVIQVTPLTSGTVVAIDADDTDYVKAGQRLVQLDDTDAKVALAQAEAELAQAVRQVRSLFTNNDALRAKIAFQETSVAQAMANLKRRNGLTKSGAVSFEEMNHSEDAVKAAQSELIAAKEALAGNIAYTENTTIPNHPNVLNAATKVRAAYLALQRTKIVAAVDGQVAKRSVQLGQHIAPGSPLMAIIPLGQVWIDANFKESQLADMRIGQPVAVSADIYGGKVDYTGHIVGLAAGTGSAFSLLPAQNATGNWIKVVQRLPVRVQIDPKDLQTHPLRIGLSVTADVDITDRNGAQLSSQARQQPAWKTAVYENTAHEADAVVQQIIDANAGPTSKRAAANSHAQRNDVAMRTRSANARASHQVANNH